MYAQFENRDAWLSSEFGERYARKLFGDAIVDKLPRYVRGKRKGAIKGRLCWRKCVRGGWVRDGAGYRNGHVERRVGSVVYATIDDGSWSAEPKIVAVWEPNTPPADLTVERNQLDNYDRGAAVLLEGILCGTPNSAYHDLQLEALAVMQAAYRDLTAYRDLKEAQS